MDDKLPDRKLYKKSLTNELRSSGGMLFSQAQPSGGFWWKVGMFISSMRRRTVRTLGLVRVKQQLKLSEKSAPLGEDNAKKWRIRFVSTMIVALFLVFRQLAHSYLVFKGDSIYQLFLFALGFGAFAIISMLWVFRDEMNLKTLLTLGVFMGSSVFGVILFIELFFIRYLDKFSMWLSFVGILIFLWLYLYVIFLTVNIFNVAKIRVVPLLQVAQTAAYIVAVINAYIVTYSFLAFNLPLYFMALLPVISFILVFPVISTFHFSRKERYLYAFSIGWCSFIPLVASIFFPIDYKVVAIIPSIVILTFLGGLMNHWRKKLNFILIIEYLSVLMVFLRFFYLSINY